MLEPDVFRAAGSMHAHIEADQAVETPESVRLLKQDTCMHNEAGVVDVGSLHAC